MRAFSSRLGWLVPFALAWPVLLGARGCEPDPVPIGGDECDAAACGPALGLPTTTCADGSTGGNTGHCISSGDPAACHWEVRECPPVACTSADCGAPPPIVPGQTISCERVDPTTSCQWVISSDPTCNDPTSCGPAPGIPSWLCADGSTGGFTGQCIAQRDGTCGWEVRSCDPTTECTLIECGPMPGGPATICADGSVGGNTGHCIRDASGVCGWEQRTCPMPTSCGGFDPTTHTCAAGEVCIQGVGLCRAPDAGGVCIVPPETCTEEWAPVCGCDDRTYSNACHALGNGVSILHDGACEGSTPTACGGLGGFACPSGEYCNYPVDPTTGGVACGAADGLGQCETIPNVCPAVEMPVCGCDGVTYGNGCQAAGHGVSVQHDGACTPSTTSCGGLGGATCAAGQYCDFGLDPSGATGSCGAADQLGQCEVLPAVCPDVVIPVCGCDGHTYFNDCEAASHGVSIQHGGPC